MAVFKDARAPHPVGNDLRELVTAARVDFLPAVSKMSAVGLVYAGVVDVVAPRMNTEAHGSRFACGGGM